MAELRKRGLMCGVVERFNRHAGPAGIRQDLFGFIDVVALDGEQIVGVQCCAGSGHAAHVRKITQDCSEAAAAWIKSGGRIELWSWSKRKVKRNSKAIRWTPRIEVIDATAVKAERTKE